MAASNISLPPASELDAKVPYAYTYQLWSECMEDCARGQAKAEQQYSRITQSVLKVLQQRAKANVQQPFSPELQPLQPAENSAPLEHSIEIEDPESETVKWEKPGALARRVGIKQTMLRTLADAQAVETMISPGGHRLFNIASVLQYISSQSSTSKEASSSKRRKRDHAASAAALSDSSIRLQDPMSSFGTRQLLVFVRLSGADQSQVKQDAAASEIQSQVFAHMEWPCTKQEMESCSFLLELESDEPGQPFSSLFNTVSTRNLLKHICSREYTRTLLILRTLDDIASEPSTRSLFKQLCRNMNVSIQLLPQLPSQL